MNAAERNTIIQSYEPLFHSLKNKHHYSRLGKTFSTQQNHYFLDTGTGKIFKVNKNK